jgi:hypothetical protein
MGRRTLLAALGVPLGVAALLFLLIPLFAGPASSIEPRDLPVVVAGPQAATAEFAATLEAARPGAFAVTQVADAAAADQALKDRTAYAAFVIGRDGVALHTASAASPTVAALLTGAAQQLAQGKPVPVTDVAPLPADDPRGSGFAAGFFPLMIAGLFAAVALFLAVPRNGARLLGVLVFAALAGAAGTLILQTWMGIIGGDFLPVAAAIGLIVLAVSGSVLGLASLIGPAGIGLGAVLIMLVGNALAGVAAAPELLPQPWGEVGQWMPIGAGATALRSTAWFGGAGADSALWTLGAWAGAGLLLLALAWVRQPAPAMDEPREAARKLGQAVV